MNIYEVEFHVTSKARFPAESPEAAVAAVRAIRPEAKIVYACRVDLLGEITPDQKPPTRPRGKPTPGGGSPAGGVVGRPVFTEARAA